MALLNGSRSLAPAPDRPLAASRPGFVPLAMLGAFQYLAGVFLRRIRSPEPPIEHEEGSVRAAAGGLSFVIGDSIMRRRPRSRGST
jgi:hypothetical protein